MRYQLILFLLFISQVVIADTQLISSKIVPGGIFIADIATVNQPCPKAQYQNTRVMVVPHHGHWFAVLGIPMDTKSGIHELEVLFADQTKRAIDFVVPKPKRIGKGKAQLIRIKDKRLVTPDWATQQKIQLEAERIKTIYANWSEDAPQSLHFSRPVRGKITSGFGWGRVFNRVKPNWHQGIDIAAHKGTYVRSPAAGEIINADRYVLTGNTVFVDHGQGLITCYCHLDKILVTEHAKIKRGQIIGTVGTTGRSTGPHLHWGVVLNQAKVNPKLFI